MPSQPQKKSIANLSLFLRLGLPVLITAMLFLFQNCGATHNQLGTATQMSIYPPQVDGYLVLEDPAKQNTAFRITLSGTEIKPGTDYYWSAVYAGGTHCAQTLSGDGVIATFNCQDLGGVAIRLVTTDVDGAMNIYDWPIVVGDGITGTLPQPGPLPTPTPGPPTPPDGPTLYATNCSGCHTPLATSTKRGITRSQLDQGIAIIGAMSNLSFLSSAERDAIVQALQ